MAEIEKYINKIHCGSALDMLKTLPDNSINCCISSPPYWALRDYGVDGQLGLESTFEEYLDKLLAIYDEVKRVLRKDGTCFVNLGDTYSGGGRGYEYWNEGDKQSTNMGSAVKCPKINLPDKCLLMIPERFAIGMIERDTMDIYELDKSWIMCNNIDITNNPERNKYAVQRPRKSETIQHCLSPEVETGTQTAISETIGGLAEKESRQNKRIPQEILLGEQGTGDSQSDEGQCEILPEAKNESSGSIWWKSSEVCMLWGNNNIFSNNSSSKQRWRKTPEADKKIRLNFSVAKESELSERFRSFVYELQFCDRQIWILPPQRGQNFSLRKRDIPIDLLPLFKLKKEERWILRNKLIWHKPNPMPSSAGDRFTVDFEPVFFFSKNKQYFFEPQYEEYEQEPKTRNRESNFKNTGGGFSQEFSRHKDGNPEIVPNPLGRNKRCVWTIPTQACKEAHFATYPEKLVQPMIEAGCPMYVCNKCGKPRKKIYDTKYVSAGEISDDDKSRDNAQGNNFATRQYGRADAEHLFKGYSSCGCNEYFCNSCKMYLTSKTIMIESDYAIQKHRKETGMCKELGETPIPENESGRLSDSGNSLLQNKDMFELWKRILREKDASDLLQEMRSGLANQTGQSQCLPEGETFSELQGGIYQQERLQDNTNKQQIHNGTPLLDGKTFETKIDRERTSTSQERNQNGQQNFQSDSGNQGDAQWQCVLSVLQQTFQSEITCPFCNSNQISIKHASFSPGIVLDPFGGMCTTAVVAYKLKRDYVMIELNKEYIKMAEKRLHKIKDNYALIENNPCVVPEPVINLKETNLFKE